MQLAHVRETLYRFGEVFNGFVCIAVFDAVPDTVLDVSLQNNLSAAVQGGFCGIDLRQNIFAGDILVDHAVNCLYLSDNFFQSAVQIVSVHTLFHAILPPAAVCDFDCFYCNIKSAVCQASDCVCHAILIANPQNAAETEETCC